LEVLETLFGHDPEKATRPARGAIGPGRMLALGALVFLLSGPAPAGETEEESAEAPAKEFGAVLDDTGLVKVHGRGAEPPAAAPGGGDAGVILWDERGQGGSKYRHGEDRATGSGNVQGTGLILNRR
jgi:hypothetical protein